MRLLSHRAWLAVVSGLLLMPLAACDDPIGRGEALFSDRAVSESASNQLTCAICHDVVPVRSDSPGLPLAGAFRRPTFWGGDVLDVLSAVDVCMTEFMGGRELPREGEDSRALAAYLAYVSRPERTPAGLDGAQPYSLPASISAQTLAAFPPGDVVRGAARWDSACRTCHGDAGTGKGRLTSETSVVPNSIVNSIDFPDPMVKRVITVEKIRHGKLFGIGGKMPPFSPERLDDQALSDLIEYFETLGLPPG